MDYLEWQERHAAYITAIEKAREKFNKKPSMRAVVELDELIQGLNALTDITPTGKWKDVNE